jgi:BON domain-containing protein
MAFDRGERGHRLEQYPRRGESERDRRDRGYEERELYDQRENDDDMPYTRLTDRRHWRGHDYDQDPEEDLERGRDYSSYGRERAFLRPERRDRILRSGERADATREYAGARARDWRGAEAWRDDWSGPYAGRGPKGYRRSDERILEDVCERLTEHPSIDASDVEVSVNEGDVTLSGRVDSRAVKHLTEVMAETVSGVKEVHNQLRVAALEHREWSRPSPEERREGEAPEAVAPKTGRR